MTREKIVIVSAGAVILFLLVLVILRKRPKKLKTAKYVVKWRELQQHCKNKADWPEALKAADKLLDQALKKKRFKGKTMGARLMAAQRQIKDNDGIWVAHKLTVKLIELTADDKIIKLAKTEVKVTLQSYQEALVDLGALRRAK